MLAKERLNTIIKLLEDEGTVQVKHLAKKFNVTEDLIRKDLKKLEKLGLIDRVHGGAERREKKFELSTIQHRMAHRAAHKKIIAEKAYNFIESGEHIFLDTSSTSAHIADCIAEGEKQVTVITDMLYILTRLSGLKHVTVIAIGGTYNRYTGGFHGHFSLETIRRFALDRAFVSCRSIDVVRGAVFEGFMDIAETKRAILDTARVKVVATQCLKFENQGVFEFYDLAAIDVIICEAPLEGVVSDVLKQLKVKSI